MRYLFTLLIFLSSSLLMAQDIPCPPSVGCRCLLEKADAVLQQPKPDYQRALYLYFAAQACDPSLTSEAEEQIVQLFNKVENLRITAENRATLIQRQQQQLIAEKEAAELATRQAKAQNLNNLASRAIEEGRMGLGLQFMQYAVAYDPGQINWLANLHELYASSEFGFRQALRSDLFPSYHRKFPEGMNGLLVYSKSDQLLSWYESGQLILHHNPDESEVVFQHTEALTGARTMDQSNSIYAWDAKGTLLVLNENWEVSARMEHGASIRDIYELPDEKGLLSWSNGIVYIWNLAGELQNRIHPNDADIVQLHQRETPEGFLLLSEEENVRILDKHGNFLSDIKVEGSEGITSGPDSTFVTWGQVSINLWSPEGVSLANESSRVGFDNVLPLPEGGYIFTRGQTDYVDNINAANQIQFSVIYRTGSIIGAQEEKTRRGALMWNDSGDLMQINWINGALNRKMEHDNGLAGFMELSYGAHIVSWDEEGFLFYWDQEGNCWHRMYHGQPADGVVELASEQQWVSWSEDGSLRYWGYPKAEGSHAIPVQHNADYRALPGSEHFSFTTSHGQPIRLVNAQLEVIDSLDVEFNGTPLIEVGSDQILFIGRGTVQFTDRQFNTLESFALDPQMDSRFEYLEQSRQLLSYGFSGAIYVMDLQSGLVREYDLGNGLSGISLLPDESGVVGYGEGRDLVICDFSSGETRSQTSPAGINGLQSNPSGNGFISWNNFGVLQILDRHLDLVQSIETDLQIRGMYVLPNQQGVLLWDKEGTLQIRNWQAELLMEVQTFEEVKQLILSEEVGGFFLRGERTVSFWSYQGILISQVRFYRELKGLTYDAANNKLLCWSKDYAWFIPLDPESILSGINDVGITDFTDQEKEKYGIDLDMEVDWEYAPYPWMRGN